MKQSKVGIETLKDELIDQDETTSLIGQERQRQKGIFGNIFSFDCC